MAVGFVLILFTELYPGSEKPKNIFFQLDLLSISSWVDHVTESTISAIKSENFRRLSTRPALLIPNVSSYFSFFFSYFVNIFLSNIVRSSLIGCLSLISLLLVFHYFSWNKMAKLIFIISLLIVYAAINVRAADDLEVAWQKYQVS